MKYLFIHIPKTGGSSIVRSNSLKRVLFQPSKSILKPVYRMELDRYSRRNEASSAYGHCRWRDINLNTIKKYTCVAVVRNPWSKLVSQYNFAKKIFLEGNAHRPAIITDKTSFDEFLSFYEPARPFGWHRTTIGFYPQTIHVTDIDKTLKCDILRFENFDQDTMRYFKIKKPLVPRNVTNMTAKPYTEFYNDKTIQMVADWYKDDIDMWGFDFDTSATKNFFYEDSVEKQK